MSRRLLVAIMVQAVVAVLAVTVLWLALGPMVGPEDRPVTPYCERPRGYLRR